MKLLVTGGCGFIGSNFVRYWRLHHPHDKICVIDKLTYAGHKENLDGIIDIELHIGDICDREFVSKHMHKTDVVVHFAAESHVDRSIVNPSVFIQTNVLGTHVLLEEALREGVKLFHHISTDEVFGTLTLTSKKIFSEKTPYTPRSPYSASKASSDHLVLSYFHTYNLPVTVSNASNNYGPYQDPEKLIPHFITNILKGKKVTLMGTGENIRDWLHVEDHCHAIELIIKGALQNKKIIGQTFCIGASAEKSNYQITKYILDFLGLDKSWIASIPHRKGHDLRYAIDATKIRRLLGWKPNYSFEEGILQTIEWYKKNENWWKPLKKAL